MKGEGSIAIKVGSKVGPCRAALRCCSLFAAPCCSSLESRIIQGSIVLKVLAKITDISLEPTLRGEDEDIGSLPDNYALCHWVFVN